jgi:hypothetical protein
MFQRDWALCSDQVLRVNMMRPTRADRTSLLYAVKERVPGEEILLSDRRRPIQMNTTSDVSLEM